MLDEGGPFQHLGEQIRWVVVGVDLEHLHDPLTPELAHLELLAVDVPRVLRAVKPVA